MSSCLRRTLTLLGMAKALVCRGLFTLHSLICIWRVTVIKHSPVYWSLAGTLPLVLVETGYTLHKKKNGEWKWICPSVLLYIMTSIPAIWFLELDVMNHRLLMAGLSRPVVVNTSKEVLLLNGQIHLAISLGSEEWCKILEQMLLLILIVGRWLLPKGEITREQLSQLLLVYIGMAADIIELFEAFKEDTVRGNKLLTIIILSLWTASLTQFTFVVTATKSRKARTGVAVKEYHGSATCPNNGARGCCPTEVLSILLSVFLQDAPFLVLRLLLIFRYDVLSYSNIFFTSKNSLVLTLQLYRLVVLFTDNKSSPATKGKTRHYVSSYSDTLSLSSDIEESLSDYDFSVPDHISDGSDNPRPRHLKCRRDSQRKQVNDCPCERPSGSSFETELSDSMACSYKAKRKALVLENNSDSSAVRHNERRKMSTSPKKSPTRTRRRDHQAGCEHARKVISSGGEADNVKGEMLHRNDKRSRRSKERIYLQYEGQGRKVKGRPRIVMNSEMERVVKHIKRTSKSPSPSPPHPPESLDTSEVSDEAASTHVMEKKGPPNRRTVDGVCSGREESRKPSPKRQRPEEHKSSRQHQSQREEREDSALVNKAPRNPVRSPRPQRTPWSSVRNLRSVLTFLDDKGKYHTVVLKEDENGSPVYIVDGRRNSRHNISV